MSDVKKPSKNTKIEVLKDITMNYVEKPLTNEKLKEYIETLKKDPNEENIHNVYNEIAYSPRFLSVVYFDKEPNKDGESEATLKEDTTMSFPMLSLSDTEIFYPVFTDWEELYKWDSTNEDTKAMIFKFDDYAAMVLDSDENIGMMINPYGDYFYIDKETVISLKEWKDNRDNNLSEMKMKENTEVIVGQPSVISEELVEAVKDFLETRLEARAAWLLQMFINGEMSHLIVVDFDGDKKEIFKGIGEAAQPHMTNKYVDIIPYEKGGVENQMCGKEYVKDVEPFFKR